MKRRLGEIGVVDEGKGRGERRKRSAGVGGVDRQRSRLSDAAELSGSYDSSMHIYSLENTSAKYMHAHAACVKLISRPPMETVSVLRSISIIYASGKVRNYVEYPIDPYISYSQHPSLAMGACPMTERTIAGVYEDRPRNLAPTSNSGTRNSPP